MGVGLRKKAPVELVSKLHSIIMGETGRGKTHFGSTCPDPFTIGFDDRVYGVKGIQSINIKTLESDILEPKDLDRKLGVFIINNPKKIMAAKVEYKDPIAKMIFNIIAGAIKEKKEVTKELVKAGLVEKFPKNTKVINALLDRSPMDESELTSTVERIEYRNFFISELGEFEKTDKGLTLKIFRILLNEILSEGYKTLNIDDGKSFVDMCANYMMEEKGIDEFGGLPMGQFYPIYRDFTQDEMKRVLSEFQMVNVFCHEDYVELSDEKTDTKHMKFYPDFGDKKCLNEDMANWFTLVGRAILDPEDEENPYKIDFTPKRYSLSKAPFEMGIKHPIPNNYESLTKFIKK